MVRRLLGGLFPSGKTQPHKQIPVNVTAYVDEGIKDLVELLNTFDSVWSSESCQGYSNDMVCIVLHYGALGDYEPIRTMEFVEKLAKAIKQVAIQIPFVTTGQEGDCFS